MKKTVIILSAFILTLITGSCIQTKQSNNKELSLYDSIEQARMDSIWQEMQIFDSEVFIDEMEDVFIVSEKYKDKKGISVNSTLEEFAEKYPDFRILYVSEKNLFIVEAFQAPLIYVLDENNFIGKLNPLQEITQLNMSDFKPSTKITKLWIK